MPPDCCPSSPFSQSSRQPRSKWKMRKWWALINKVNATTAYRIGRIFSSSLSSLIHPSRARRWSSIPNSRSPPPPRDRWRRRESPIGSSCRCRRSSSAGRRRRASSCISPPTLLRAAVTIESWANQWANSSGGRLAWFYAFFDLFVLKLTCSTRLPSV